jgi:cell division protein FtsW (lipid II flippase)
LSKFATSKRSPFRAGAIAWQLAQTFWVGGLWLLHFVMLPALDQIGLAPMLVEEVASSLRPLMVAFAGFCALLQALLLIQYAGFARLWRDARAQLLAAVIGLVVVFLLVRFWMPEALYWLNFSYLLLAFCGLLLVIQPLPAKLVEGRAR